jgi:Ca-activated chloride channel family protein
VWARSRIADHMRELMVPPNLRKSGQADDALKAAVTDLGLKFSLVTQWTSFVAVSQRKVNPDPASSVDTSVPLHMVKGVQPSAYPVATRTAPIVPSQKTTYGGSAVTEPEHLFGLMLIALFLLWRLRGRLLTPTRRRAASRRSRTGGAPSPSPGPCTQTVEERPPANAHFH